MQRLLVHDGHATEPRPAAHPLLRFAAPVAVLPTSASASASTSTSITVAVTAFIRGSQELQLVPLANHDVQRAWVAEVTPHDVRHGGGGEQGLDDETRTGGISRGLHFVVTHLGPRLPLPGTRYRHRRDGESLCRSPAAILDSSAEGGKERRDALLLIYNFFSDTSTVSKFPRYVGCPNFYFVVLFGFLFFFFCRIFCSRVLFETAPQEVATLRRHFRGTR